MENESIVINSGPLILLDRINALDIPGRMPYRFVSPPAVRDELDKGLDFGYKPIVPDWLIIRGLSSPVSPIIEKFMDRGEAEVIQLALDEKIDAVCLDDLRGRGTAQALGLDVMGLLGLLGKAKAFGVIPLLKPVTDRLLEEGAWYSPKIIKKVLAGVGE